MMGGRTRVLAEKFEKTKELGESQGSTVSCKPREEAFITRKKKWSTA